MALKGWQNLDPARIDYQIHFANVDGLPLTVQDETGSYITAPAIPSNSTSKE